MTFLKRYKKQITVGIVCYTILVSLLVMIGSLASSEQRKKQEPAYFTDEWEIWENGVKKEEKITLPFVPKSREIQTVDIYNQVPETPFLYPTLTLSMFQTDIEVYLDEKLVFEQKFEQKLFNQNTPGSAVYSILLPQNAEGKTIQISYQKKVSAETIHISEIPIQEGLLPATIYIPRGSVMFFLNIAMLTLGVFIFLFALINTFFKERRIPLLYLALFFISTTLWFLCKSKMIQFFVDNTVLIHNLEYMSLYFIPIAIWSFIRYNWKRGNKLCRITTKGMVSFYILAVTLKVTGVADYFYLISVFHALCVINVILFFIMVYQERKIQSKSKTYFYTGMLVFCIAALIDLGKYYLWYSNDTMDKVYAAAIFLMYFCMMLSFLRASQTVLKEGLEGKLYQKLAFTDTLTGMGNRLACDTHMKRVEEAKIPVVLIMMDVNGLKIVNDIYGHQSGDLLIKIVAEEMEHVFIKDTCYRMGGDEFCVILEYAKLQEIELKVQEFKQKIKQRKEEFPISVACGMAEYTEIENRNLEQILKEADDKMYENKKQMKIMENVMCRVERSTT